jgi:hypothetical protein
LLIDVVDLPTAILQPLPTLPKMAFPSPSVSFLCLGVAVVLLLARVLYLHLTSPLGHIPGPFWARFTDLWRLVDYYQSTQIETQRRLHEQLGPVVRIGPNIVSLSDPQLVKVVYSTRGEYLKVGRYPLPFLLASSTSVLSSFLSSLLSSPLSSPLLSYSPKTEPLEVWDPNQGGKVNN